MKFFKRLLKKQGRASRINVVPPKPYENRQGVALVLIVKNEQDTLKDWLAFHTLAGVSNFYVYDNGSTDNTKQIVKSFTGAGFEYIPWAFNGTTHERNVFLPQQILAYSHAICTFGASHEWMGFIDADEYIVPTGSDCIATVLDNNKDRPNLSLPWVMFGHSGHADRPKAPLPFAFVERARELRPELLHFKCIVDPSVVSQVSTHKFQTFEHGSKTWSMSGVAATNKTRNTAEFLSPGSLQLNHYYLRSEAEMWEKINGSAVSGIEKEKRKNVILSRAKLIEEDIEIDKTTVQFLSHRGIDQAKFEKLRDEMFDL